MSEKTGVPLPRARSFVPFLLAAALLLGASAGCGPKPDEPLVVPAPGPASKTVPEPASGTVPAPAPAPPAKDADLAFRFPDGFSFGLRVKALHARMQGTRGGEQTFDLRMQGKVRDVEDGRPARLELFDVSGPQEYREVGGDGASEPDKTVNEGGTLIGGIDGSWRMTDAADGGKLSDDILMVYPAGPVFGFVPPGGKLEAGGRWASGDLVPAGPKTLSKKEIVFSEARGEFELEELAALQARILWTGSAKAEFKGGAANSASWSSTVLFDVKAGRTKSVETEFRIDCEAGVVIRFRVEASFTYP
jgi:hypothetical protein